MERPFITLPFEYNGIIYDVFRAEHSEDAIQNLIYEFALREKMNQAVGITIEDFIPFAQETVKYAAETGLSVVGIESNTGKLAAPLFTWDYKHHFAHTREIPSEPKLKPIFDLLGRLSAQFETNHADLLNKKLFYMDVLAVPSKYKGRGVGFTLWFASLVRALDLGYNIIVTSPTDGDFGPNSKHCVDKMKFKKLYEVRYQDYEYNGEKVFSSITDAECCFFAYRTLHSQSELWDILGDKTINIL
jgi:hypothetical protein